MVTLPLRLYWSPPGRVWDLDDLFMLRSMYQAVLGEAIRAGELTGFLNRDRLVAVWRELYLPKGVRRAWGERHPLLRAATAESRTYYRAAPHPAGVVLHCGRVGEEHVGIRAAAWRRRAARRPQAAGHDGKPPWEGQQPLERQNGHYWPASSGSPVYGVVDVRRGRGGATIQ